MLREGLGGKAGLHRAESPACGENLLLRRAGAGARSPQGLWEGAGLAEILGSHGWLESPSLGPQRNRLCASPPAWVT